ncbi:MAG: DUF2007 domain-containing protein [Bacteroidales bacterium]|nr:DUF2007 domain-containing protein [Bacteroidales bacterium]
MDNNWTKISTTPDQYKAELIKGFLAEHDIEVFIINKKDSAYLFGELEIYVLADNAVRANHLLTSNSTL